MRQVRPRSLARSHLQHLASLAVVLALVHPAFAATSPKTGSLRWVRAAGAESCITGRALAEGVEQTLGRALFVETGEADISVEGRVAARTSPPGWKAEIRVSGATGAILGERSLEAEGTNCHALDASLIFVVAVMVDPEGAAHPERSGAIESPLPPPPRPAAPAAQWQPQAGVGPAMGLGMLPQPAFGPSGHVRIALPVWGVELYGAFMVPLQRQRLGGSGGASVQWSFSEAGLSVCPRFMRLHRLSFIACAGVDGAATVSQGEGFSISSSNRSAFALPTAGLRAEWTVLPALFLTLGGHTAIPTARDSYSYTMASGTNVPVFKMTPAVGTLEASLGLAW